MFKHPTRRTIGFALASMGWSFAAVTAKAQNTPDAGKVKTAFKEALLLAVSREKYVEIDGPSISVELSVGSHVNGMAVLTYEGRVNHGLVEWVVVNYPNFDGKKGRLIYWNTKSGAANLVEFSMDSGTGDQKRGFPACMQADRGYLVVGTGESGYAKFFDFTSPSAGVKELTWLEIPVAGMVENVGIAYHPELRKYIAYARNGDGGQFWLSVGNDGPNLSKASKWEKVNALLDVPFGEAGTPLMHLSGNMFALLSLGTDKDNDSYAFKLSFIELTKQGGGSFNLAFEPVAGQYSFRAVGEGGGAPSFRWGGTARVVRTPDQTQLSVELLAAPKRLDASGNYYKWYGSVKVDRSSRPNGPESAASTDTRISAGTAISLKLNDTSNYLGPNKDDYASIGGRTLYVPQGTGFLQDGLGYKIKLGGKWLYETAKGNVGFWASDSGAPSQWTIVKLRNLCPIKDEFIRPGDVIKLRNGYWTDNFLYDYGSGYAAAGANKQGNWVVGL